MKTLISMTDFVTASFNKIKKNDTDVIMEYLAICKYSLFLKQYLEKWMCVPCDNEGNVLQVPYYSDGVDKVDEYKKAKEKVLFEGFHSIGDKEIELLNSDNWISFTEKSIDFTNEFGHETIIYRVEDLIELELKLTPTALKQIGL